MVKVMAWVYLVLASLLEVVWAVAMKESQGVSRLGPTAIMIGAMAASLALLALAMRSLPLGTAYMIWTGLGAVGTFAAGVWLFGEALTLQRVIAALLVISGMVAFKLS